MHDFDLASITPAQVIKLPNDQLRHVMQQIVTLQKADRKENQILYYEPAQPKCLDIHKSRAKYVGISGGNRSSKTDTVLAQFSMLATGMWPGKYDDLFRPMFRGPVKIRVVVESFTTTLYPTILPKLQWWKWNGSGEMGGDKGHWGWIPKTCLIDGSWERSWHNQRKTLTTLCKDPDNPDKVLGETTWQFMSKDQDSEDFASGEFHWILHDEPPKHAQWIENEARVISTNGRLFLAFTWPDDPTVPVDWVHDEVYDKAQEPEKSPDHDWFEIWTTENVNIDQDSVLKAMENWSEETKRVRIYGGSMRFSNRIHPLFTDVNTYWCFTCKQTTFGTTCERCMGTHVAVFNHVQSFDHNPAWPCIWVLDPHPRKPHMYLWAQVDPQDDIWVVADGECQDEPAEVHREVEEVEEALGIYSAVRLIDPNMGEQVAGTRREVTWKDAFDQAGLMCDSAVNSDVGRATLNEYLKPDHYTERPRIHVHPRCQQTIFQMKRYVWDDHKTALEKDLKQKAKPKNDDYPTMLKYLMNYSPNFNWLQQGAPIIKKPYAKR